MNYKNILMKSLGGFSGIGVAADERGKSGLWYLIVVVRLFGVRKGEKRTIRSITGRQIFL
jgi:hypothetical protein